MSVHKTHTKHMKIYEHILTRMKHLLKSTDTYEKPISKPTQTDEQT